MNEYLIAVFVCLFLAAIGAGYLIYRQRKSPAAQTVAKASAVSAVVEGLKPHIKAALLDAKTHTESAIYALRAELRKAPTNPARTLADMAGDSAPQFGAPVEHPDGMMTISKLNPAAPAASVAGNPPTAAPPANPEPLAGSGGTDKVAAKRAQLERVIADAQAQLAALAAAQAALDKLTEAA